MPTKVNIGGSWRDVIGQQMNVGGTWRSLVKNYVNINGTFRDVAGGGYTNSFF